MHSAEPTSPAPGRLSIPKFPAAFVGFTLLSAAAWTAVASGNPLGGAIALVFKLVTSAWMPLVYLFASLGIGVAILQRLAPTVTSRAVAVCLGLSGMLTFTHLLGWTGLLGGAKGGLVAWVPVLLGAVLAWKPASRWWEEAKGAPSPSRWWFVIAPAFGLMLAAACSTPGWLWSSEFGGFDALSYHLQLPQEWIAAGRVTPVRHNVYSYLPSYVEAAFLHCSMLSFPPSVGTENNWGFGLLAREGQGLIAAQLLHALIAMLAAVAVGRAASGVVDRILSAGGLRSDNPRLASSVAGAIAAGLFAWTPWSVVVGSLAYNEMVMLLMAAGIMVALTMECTPMTRWLLVAVLVGAACGAKLTAILFLGVPAAVALIAVTPRREMVKPALAAAVVGVLMLAPWMARNALDTGNPVFPFAAGVFESASGGTGHWTPDQVERFASSHRFDGSIADRLRLSVLATPDPGNPQNTVHRGLMHPQWGWIFAMFALALLGLLPRWNAMSRFGRAAVILLAGAVLVQFCLWLFATHVQSRFLLPLLPCVAAVIAVCVGLVDAHNLRSGAAAVLVGTQAFTMYNVLAKEHSTGKGGAIPLGAVPAGVSSFTGEMYARGSPVVESMLSPEQWLNVSLKGGTRILLVGDCAPLYYRHPLAYSTTWDENPLARILTEAKGDPDATSAALRKEGYEFVLVNVAELTRYERSGFLDPRLSVLNLKPWMEQSVAAAHVWDGGARLLLRPLLAEERDAIRARQREAPQPPPPPGGPTQPPG